MITFPTASIAPFTPNMISGVKCWMRSDIGIVLTSSHVTSWADLSGNNNGATGASSTGPTYSSSGGINNRARLTLNGSQGMNWSLALSGAKTIMMVVKLSSTPGSGAFYSFYTILNGSLFCEWLQSNLGGAYTTQTFIHDITNGGGAQTAVGYNVSLGTSTGKAVIISYNGGTNTSTSSYSSLINNATQVIATSSSDAQSGLSGSWLGARSGLTSGIVGDLYEVIAYNRVLTTSETNELWAYVEQNYGL